MVPRRWARPDRQHVPGSACVVLVVLRRIRWEDYEIEGPGAEEWRRRHHRRAQSHKSLLVTVALIAPVFAVLLEVVLELREVLEQAVRFFLSYFLLVSKVVRAE